MVDSDLSSLPRDPATARDLLADQLQVIWTELLERTVRRGHAVHYRRTDLGDALLRP